MEHPPKSAQVEGLEKGPQAFVRLGAAIESLKNRVRSTSERSDKPIDVSQDSVERVSRKTGKIRKALNLAAIGSALISAAGTVDYATSRYQIAKSVAKDGSVSYEHQDEETNEIMAYIAGGKDLPERDRVYFYRQMAREEFRDLQERIGESYGLKEANQFESRLKVMDETQVRKEMIMLHKNLLLKRAEEWKMPLTDVDAQIQAELEVDTLFSDLIQSQPANPRLEQALWNIQQKVGAPRLRWVSSDEGILGNVESSIRGPGRAHYDPETNTVFLTPGDAVHTLIQEDSHALQFDIKPVGSHLLFVINTASSALSAVKEGKTLYDTQQYQYEEKGTLENDAHSKIEPELWKEYRAGMGIKKEP